MTKKHVTARRERLRQIAASEWAARCQHCHLPLSAVRLQMGQRFCDDTCEETELAFLAHLAGARQVVR